MVWVVPKSATVAQEGILVIVSMGAAYVTGATLELSVEQVSRNHKEF